MIAYNKEWLDALAAKAQVKKWATVQLINTEQWQHIEERFYSAFYTPNFLVRVGLFTFCWILVASVLGLIGTSFMVLLAGGSIGIGSILLIFGTVLVAALEFFIWEKKFYKGGIDDALLYMALALIITGFGFIFSGVFNDHAISYLFLALPFLMIGAIRYTDTLVTVILYACLVGILFLLLEKNSFTRLIIPFVCMAFAGATLWWAKQSLEREDWRFWTTCIRMVEACSLITIYLSSNYFVVKELGESLFPDFKMPVPFLFYLITALLPVFYIYKALQTKNRLLLHIGLVLFVLSVLTFKYYFSLGHHEVTITVAGALLTIFAYFSIKLLKKPLGDLTYELDVTEENEGQIHIEALSATEIVNQSESAPRQDFKFGGGQFGGGGAGGSF